MNIQEIEQLSLSDQMYLLKQNGNKVNLSKIKKNIAFYEGKHPILYDPDMDDFWVDEERIGPDGKQSGMGLTLFTIKFWLSVPVLSFHTYSRL